MKILSALIGLTVIYFARFAVADNTWASTTGSAITARAEYTATLMPDGKILAVGGRDSSGALTTSELYDPATESWAATSGHLTTARYAHTATLLPDGRVLVAGGTSDGSTSLTSAEFFDPSTGNWTASGTINQLHGRRLHTATLLPNGKVLFAGGYNPTDGGLDTSELYDPSANTWTASGTMKAARRLHTATLLLLPNGKVLVAGGYDGSSSMQSSELYDPVAGTWDWTASATATTAMNYARCLHTATLLVNGKVLVAGGGDVSGTASSYCELYDPVTETWSPTGSLDDIYGRRLHSATLLPNGRVLVAGGEGGSGGSTVLGTAQLYDPNTGFWSQTGSLANGRIYAPATLLNNGKVLVAGGQGSSSFLSSSELFTPSTRDEAWTMTGTLNTGRGGNTATLLPSGKVLVAGGAGGNVPSTSCELYDPAGESWAVTGSFNNEREGFTTTLLPNGNVLVAGGDDPSVTTGTAELYNGTSWTTTGAGTMNSPRDGHTATLLPNGKVLVVGGIHYISTSPGYELLTSAELYDPTSGSWTPTSTSMATGRIGHTATLLPNGKVLVVGGMGGGATAEIYDPPTDAWSTAHSMGAARWGHTATLLPNGKVLVVGGDYAGNSAELYDPVADEWTTASAPGIDPSWGSTATLLPNGKVLVTGGYDNTSSLDFINAAELYDPASGSWSTTASLNVNRFDPTATLLPNGTVLLVGGGNDDSGALSSCEIYGPVPNAYYVTKSGSDSNDGSVSSPWLTVAHSATRVNAGDTVNIGPGIYDEYPNLTVSGSPFKPITFTSLTNGVWLPTTGTTVVGADYLIPLANGKTLAIAVPYAYLYDPVAQTWSTTGSLSSYPAVIDGTYSATLLRNGKVLVAGGIITDGDPTGSAQLYDPASESWTATTHSMNTPRGYHSATLLSDGKVLVAGGGDSYGPDGGYIYSSSELYDPETDQWAYTTGPMNSDRQDFTATLLPGGKVLVAGGYCSSSDNSASAELYDPITETWSATGWLNTARCNHASVLLQDGRLMVLGGYDGAYSYPVYSAELYDPVSGSWTTAASQNTTRFLFASTLLANGKVLVAGGYPDPYTGDPLASSELYDPGTDVWTVTSPLNYARSTRTMTLLPHGQVLIAGGGSQAEQFQAAMLDGLKIRANYNVISNLTLAWNSSPVPVLDMNGLGDSPPDAPDHTTIVQCSIDLGGGIYNPETTIANFEGTGQTVYQGNGIKSGVDAAGHYNLIQQCAFYGGDDPMGTGTSDGPPAQYLNIEGTNSLITQNICMGGHDIDFVKVHGTLNIISSNQVFGIDSPNYAVTTPFGVEHPDFVQLFDAGSEITVSANYLHDCPSIQVCHTEDYPNTDLTAVRDVYFVNNVFANVGSNAQIGSKNTYFYNNLFYKVGTFQDQAMIFYDNSGGTSVGSQVINNVFLECGSDPNNHSLGTIGSGGTTLSSLDIDYNYFGGTGYGPKDGPGAYTGTHAINTTTGINLDPKFGGDGGESLYDFRIGSTSPLTGAGYNLYLIFTTDKNGASRPSSGAWDVGPYIH